MTLKVNKVQKMTHISILNNADMHIYTMYNAHNLGICIPLNTPVCVMIKGLTKVHRIIQNSIENA